jgi:hypothetical protein
VERIGDNAFYGCKLSNIIVANNNKVYKTITNDEFTFVTNKETRNGIVGYLAYGKLTIPEGITSISVGEFAGYAGLTSITIPSSVTTIMEGAF